VKAIQYANKFYQGSNLRARLSVKLKNTYINSYRKVVKTRKVIDLLLFHSALYTESSRRNPAETRFILNSIQSAFKKLPDEIHQIIGLHLSGYKNREIATLTGNKLGTVKNWIHKGRNELKHSLGECQFTV
jgi:DNA-directed RNA polymerase specialized sigma24 family protein